MLLLFVNELGNYNYEDYVLYKDELRGSGRKEDSYFAVLEAKVKEPFLNERRRKDI
jgi:hypothetical protein